MSVKAARYDRSSGAVKTQQRNTVRTVKTRWGWKRRGLQARENERKDTSVSLKKKKPKLFPEPCVMSVCSQSVGYTVHVSRVHFLQSGTRTASSEWDRQEMGARAADGRTALVLD